MRILFTGASSFTGFWFVQRLASLGHEVHAIFRRAADAYKGERVFRVRELRTHCQPVWECSFGSQRFFELVKSAPSWDLLCHHAAEVSDYKSLAFDVAGALERNTFQLSNVLEAFQERGLRRVLLTGSVFEANEGAGTAPLRAFSPYGLSKTLTAQVFQFWCALRGLRFGKFVIPNPFGPLEEPRFNNYLVRSWLRGERPSVKTPLYVRDNIHASLLAIAYAAFAESLPEEAGVSRLNPTGYVESQGAFASRVAAALEARLGIPCPLRFDTQVDFSEPLVRVNSDPVDGACHGWSEERAWDELAEYYRRTMGANRAT